MDPRGPSVKNVLVVDDDRAVLSVVSRMLTGRYAVRVAEDGTAALDLVALLRPDLILLDVDMPGMDGIAVLNELRTFDPNLRVVMLTGDVNPETFALALANGAAAYLTKPFTMADIDFAVGRALAPC